MNKAIVCKAVVYRALEGRGSGHLGPSKAGNMVESAAGGECGGSGGSRWKNEGGCQSSPGE